MRAARRLPAFAKPLAEARRRGFTLRNPHVAVSLSWRRRPSTGYGIVVPDDAAPDSLEWSWCRSLDVILWRRGDDVDRVRAAVRAIRAAGPHRLLVIDVTDGGDSAAVYHIIRPEVGRGPAGRA